MGVIIPRTADQYAEMIKTLLPRGKAWSRDTTLNFQQLWESMAQELQRVDSRAGTDLFNNLDPRTATEMLSDWERICDIPDGVIETTVAPTNAGRQADIVRKLTQQGGAYANLFIAMAAFFGYTITIQEVYPAVAGVCRAGQRCYGSNWLYCFYVNIPQINSTFAVAGTALAGGVIQFWQNLTLQAIIDTIKPAHTYAVFWYGAGGH
jgi:uncharacterized protein YmfQ (DUF2313 family)